MSRFSRMTAAACIVMAVAACSDLSTQPARTPTQLKLDSAQVTLVEGSPVSLGVEVLDQDGQAMSVPAWAAPNWSSSDPTILGVDGGALRTLGPGQATATVSLAGLAAHATVRVNPREIKVSVSRSELTQDGHRGALTSGHDATLSFFVAADRPNFFQPVVRVTVFRGATPLGTLEASTSRPSIPSGPSESQLWTMVIRGELVKPGNSLVVQVDPERKLPLIRESRDRYPETGAEPLPFTMRLRVAGAYLTQSTQRLDGSVPLVAGRDALLRAFLTADGENAARPAVRAVVRDKGTVVGSFLLERERLFVPMGVDESSLQSSWNARIPGSSVKPGMTVTLEADPDGALILTPDSHPDTTLAPQVLNVPTLWLRLIPIRLAIYGTTGSISTSNEAAFIRPTLAMHPTATTDVDVRMPYVSYANPSTSDGWEQLLSELAALRMVEGSGRYYYGVLRHPGGNYTAGLGYIGWPAAIGWDNASDGPGTMAHELGHNFGLPHAPCGGPAGPDPYFPHAGGGIGAWGYNLFTGELMNPATVKDLMSYCDPAWISDYNYMKVLAYRDRWDWTATGPDRVTDRVPALLVWGRVAGGRAVLEPAFTLDMRPALPDGKGAYRIAGYDAQGGQIFAYSFTPRATDAPDGRRAGSFAFAIPARLARPDRLQRLVLITPGGAVQQVRATTSTPPVAAARTIGGTTSVSWSSSDHPMALIRDAASGQIVSFARGGTAQLPIGRNVEVLLSNGVRTVRPVVQRR